MKVSGNLLYVADGPQGLLIFDVSQPTSPALLSQFSLSAPVWDVASSGTVALLAADALGLVVVDVSNPAQVKQLSQTLLPPYNPFPAFTTVGSVTLAASVAIQGGLGYIGTTTNDPDAPATLAAFDFSQPTSPRLVGFRPQIDDDIAVVTPSGNNIFLADSGIEVQYDNSLPRNSIELFPPPAALVHYFLNPGALEPSGAYLRSKLNRNWKASVREHLQSRTIVAPPCHVRSLCP
jgi:hypothetical protein